MTARPARARLATAALLVALLGVLPGCGKDAAPPPAGDGHLPPQVSETHPAARADHVPYDLPEIWVQFTEDLDSTTVTASNVFLKRDTRRSSIAVRWDSGTRRIRIRPLETLELAETYTVELRPQIATAAGVPLGSVHWWQFSVSGLRRLRQPYPAHGSETASPITPLTWDRTETTAGEVVYDLYLSDDSAAVANRTVAPITSSHSGYVAPGSWGYGVRRWWSVIARNQTLGEVEEGPVWTFRTLPPGAPIDSVLVRASYWAFFDSRLNRTFCMDTRIVVGSLYQAVARWDLAGVEPGRTVAGARVLMTLVVGSVPPNTTILSTRAAVPTTCSLGGTGAPLAGTALASNVNFGTSLYLMSDALGAHAAAMHRGVQSAHGFTFLASSLGATFGVPPDMMLYFYR